MIEVFVILVDEDKSVPHILQYEARGQSVRMSLYCVPAEIGNSQELLSKYFLFPESAQ